ncbi:MAG: hypothetical protein L3J47_11575 [Sulfurovum sp.]|nr:hypothetical protein [Sulfurovum sp.]
MRYFKLLICSFLFQPFLFANLSLIYVPYEKLHKVQWYEKQYGLTTEHVKDYMISEKLYVAGWSKDGKFAYAVQTPNEVRDKEQGVFIIQDMVTDKVLEKIQWEFTPPKRDNRDDFVSYMKPPVAKIATLLKKYHIVTDKELLKQFPIGGVSEGNAVDAKLFMRWVNQPEMFIETEKLLTHLTLKLLKTEDFKSTKRKVVFEKRQMLPARYLDAFVGGYFKSPFESRIAVLLVMIQRGWEGPPHVLNVKLIGASLSKGFK